MKDSRRRKTKPVTTGTNTEQGKGTSDSEVKITSREDREKKLRLDAAWNRANALSEKFFGSSSSGMGKIFGYLFFGICYVFPAREKKQKTGGWLARREQNLRRKIHSLAETLPQLVYERTTMLLLLGTIVVSGSSLAFTGNFLWLLFTGLGMLSLVASTIALKYGLKGWFLAMILFLAMLGFFLEPKVIHRGLPELYKAFQMW